MLLVAPETFTGDVVTNDPSSSPTVRRFTAFLQEHPNANLLVGASSRTYLKRALRPSHTARRAGNGVWMESHNSALMLDAFSSPELFHKSRLVVGVEMTPYPAFFCKVVRSAPIQFVCELGEPFVCRAGVHAVHDGDLFV